MNNIEKVLYKAIELTIEYISRNYNIDIDKNEIDINGIIELTLSKD